MQAHLFIILFILRTVHTNNNSGRERSRRARRSLAMRNCMIELNDLSDAVDIAMRCSSRSRSNCTEAVQLHRERVAQL